ncbi:hypothetical protein Tco_1156203 [Tanacetum coccineum]
MIRLVSEQILLCPDHRTPLLASLALLSGEFRTDSPGVVILGYDGLPLPFVPRPVDDEVDMPVVGQHIQPDDDDLGMGLDDLVGDDVEVDVDRVNPVLHEEEMEFDVDYVVRIDEEVEVVEPEVPIIPVDSIATSVGARISVRPQPSTPSVSADEAARLLSLPMPPPSPLDSVSSPSVEELLAQFIVTPPSSPDHIPTHDDVVAPLPVVDCQLPPIPPLLTFLSSVCHDEVPAYVMPPRKRLCSVVSRPHFEHGESSRAATRRVSIAEGQGVDYSFVDSVVEVEESSRKRRADAMGYGIREGDVDPTVVPDTDPLTLERVNERLTRLTGEHEHDISDLYALFEDAQDRHTAHFGRLTTDLYRVDQGVYQMNTEAIISDLRSEGQRRDGVTMRMVRVVRSLLDRVTAIEAELATLRARQSELESTLGQQGAADDADSHKSFMNLTCFSFAVCRNMPPKRTRHTRATRNTPVNDTPSPPMTADEIANLVQE